MAALAAGESLEAAVAQAAAREDVWAATRNTPPNQTEQHEKSNARNKQASQQTNEQPDKEDHHQTENHPNQTTKPPNQSKQALAREDMSKWLIERWCRGKLSAYELIGGARANLRGHPDTNDDLLRRVASLDPHNAHRDLVRALRSTAPREQPPLYEANIPLWNSDLARCEEARVPIALPHEWLNFFGAEAAEHYTEPSLEISNMLHEWKVRTRCPTEGPPIAPLSVWGDTAPFHTGRDSVLLLLWSGLAGEWRRRWITVLTKSSLCQCGCGGLHTLDAIWSIVAWSLRALASGRCSLGAFLAGKPTIGKPCCFDCKD